MASLRRLALRLILVGPLTSCGGCKVPHFEFRLPTVKLSTVELVPDGGDQDSGVGDAGCFVAFVRGLPPAAIESGADATSSNGLVGGWVGMNNTVLPSLWLTDAGLIVFSQDAGLISGRIRAFSGERGIGEALMIGQPIQAAVFDVDGGIMLLGGAPSNGAAGLPQATGGRSRDHIAFWPLQAAILRTSSRGTILGGDGQSRFVGRLDLSGGSSAVIIELDGGITQLASQSRYSGATAMAAGVVVGYEDVGELVPVRWEGQGSQPKRLPTMRGFGGAAFVDQSGGIVGTEWDSDVTRLNSAVAWTARGALIPIAVDSTSAPLSFTGSTPDGEIVGNCIIDGMTRGCIYRRSKACTTQ